MKTYNELFQFRGSSYDLAMQSFPDARDQEFLQVMKYASPDEGMIVADVPAGGGYFKRYLPQGVIWLPHEPCSSFINHRHSSRDKQSSAPLLPLPWEHNMVDILFSIAGIHHIENKIPLFKEFSRVLRPDGKLVISDVADGSPVALFLDEYVGKYNSTGHDGIFLGDDTFNQLEISGWLCESSSIEKFYWIFNNRTDMARFCHGLFDISKTDYEHTIHEIEKRLGVVDFPDGRVGMNWSLMTISAVNVTRNSVKS